MRGLYEWAVLLNVAVAVGENRRYVKGSFIEPDTLKEFEQQLQPRGLRRTETTQVKIGMETATEMSKYDLDDARERLSPKELQDLLHFMRTIFELLHLIE